MSDFDPKDIHEEVKSDFDTADIHEEVSPAQISQLQSLQKSLEQGVTLGGADETQGLIGSGMDALQALMHQQGLASPSPSQVGEMLANAKDAKGNPEPFKGDIGPQSILDAYRQTRDSARKEYDAAAAANPKTSLAGNIAGGALLAPLMPGALASPLGAAPAEAGLMQKMAMAGVNALPTGAIAGAGLSNADLTKGELGKFGKDVGTDAALGGLISAGGTAGIEGIKRGTKAIAKTDVMQNLIDAYRASKQGIKLSGEDALKSQAGGLEDLAMRARQERTEFGKARGTQKNALIKDSTAKTDTRETIKMLKKALKDNDLALSDDDKKLLKNLLADAESTLSQDSQYAKTKGEIDKLAKNESINDMNAQNVDRMATDELNQSASLNKNVDIEDLIDKTFNELGANKTMSPEQQLQMRDLQKQLRTATMESNPAQIQNVIEKVGDNYGSVSPRAKRILTEFKKGLQAKQEGLVPEVAPLNKDISENLSLSEGLLGESNLDKMLPEEIQGFQNRAGKRFQKYETDPTGVQLDTDKVLNEGLPTDFGSKTRSLKELDPGFANKFEQDLKGQSRLFDLSKTANEKASSKIGQGMFGTIAKSVESGAVKAGEAAGKIAKDNKEFLNKGITMLSDAAPEKLQQLGQRLAAQGGKAAEYAKVLGTAATKNPQSKNAIIFGLMQQPEFRELFHRVNTEVDGMEDGQ